MKIHRFFKTGAFLVLSLFLLASECFQGEPNDDPDKYSIGGTVAGLTGSGLVLRNNGADDLSITDNGSFTFSTELEDSASYDVTIETYPEEQTCYVDNGSGTVAGADVTDVSVVCETPGTVSCSDGHIVYAHDLTNAYEGFQQDIEVTGTVPFTCEEGTLTGSGVLTATINGTITSSCLYISYSGSASINVTLSGTFGASQISFDVTEVWYVGSPMLSGTAEDTCDPDSEPYSHPLIETTINHSLTFPNVNGYTETQPYVGAAGSGTYSWTIYFD
jgi:hypothetical protein